MEDNRLRKAIINNRTEHPERTNASYDRIKEVLENVLEEDAGPVIKDMNKALDVKEPGKELSNEMGERAVAVLRNRKIDREDWEEIVDQLSYSEISTGEAVRIHERYKIPVSHLEKDIVPVRGDGAYILDTKGQWYLDMDSNYSATNLGMDNQEIATGLYNQAKLLISMKEDRVQIARTRFLRHISQMMPRGLDYFYWQNSGGEAVDKCLKIAKAHTGTRDVVRGHPCEVCNIIGPC